MKLFRTLLRSFWAQNWGCPTHILSHIARYTCTKNCQKIKNWPKSRYKPIFRNLLSSEVDSGTQTLSGAAQTHLNLGLLLPIFSKFGSEKIFSIFGTPQGQIRHILGVFGVIFGLKNYFFENWIQGHREASGSFANAYQARFGAWKVVLDAFWSYLSFPGPTKEMSIFADLGYFRQIFAKIAL